MSPTFVALDFETANAYRNSACSIGLVLVQGGQIAQRYSALIRPPFRRFDFTSIHGIQWNDVARAETFAQIWPRLVPFFRGVDFIAAHNAPFDRSVLYACCDWYGISRPDAPFRCTVALARRQWNLRPTTLRHVADYLGIPLQHHRADSDAEACARIIMAAT